MAEAAIRAPAMDDEIISEKSSVEGLVLSIFALKQQFQIQDLIHSKAFSQNSCIYPLQQKVSLVVKRARDQHNTGDQKRSYGFDPNKGNRQSRDSKTQMNKAIEGNTPTFPNFQILKKQ